MKTLKGCLISLFIFFIFCFSITYCFKYFTIKSFENKYDEVNKSWIHLLTNINDKNAYLYKKSLLNDSINLYVERNNIYKDTSQNNIKIQENEFHIDKYSHDIDSINSVLNSLVRDYNDKAKNYNYSRQSFPNFLFLKGSIYNFTFKYYYINYGEINENPLIREERVNNFIETGVLNE